MPQLTRFLGAAVLAAALTLSACGAPDSDPSAAPESDQMKVVAAFYPLQFVAERVGGPEVTVTNLTQPGAEAHDVELTPRQIATLTEADVVVYQSRFQPAVDAAINQIRPENGIDVTTVVELHQLTGGGGHDHDEAGSAQDAPAGEDQGADPHVWLDPTRMITITDTVAEAMGTAQPDKAAVFRTNATALTDELTRLDETFRTGLQTCERREFVVSHAAFGYLADRYDLTQIPLRGLSPDAEPSPARIAEVQQLAREYGITTIFYETLVSPEVAESVAGDLGLKTDVLDPLEGLTEASGGQDYFEVMDANLTALKGANECQ